MNTYVTITAIIIAVVSMAQLVWSRTLIKVIRAGFVLMVEFYLLYLLRGIL